MEMTFINFWQEIVRNPMLFITVLLTLGVIFVNGWTDAPNAIATCVATRCMPVRAAIMMSAVFNFLGVFVMTQINSSVASTISNMGGFWRAHKRSFDCTVCGVAVYCGLQHSRLVFRDTDK